MDPVVAPACNEKSTIAYFYDPEVGSYYYGAGHPMKPQRIRMTHALIKGYELYYLMDVIKPHRAAETELAFFHDNDYIDFLSVVTTDNAREYASHSKRFNVGEQTDCPIFPGLFEFQQCCAGASVDAAARLNAGKADVCINWLGGLHHAKRAEASGFCYINLLKYHPRVLYIDIDIHHGDGVEEAFYTTHRVMTVSFHKYGDFFPGTGDVTDIGASAGKYYAVNVPLDDGIQDHQFLDLFKPIITKTIEITWAYETAVILNKEVPNCLPFNDYYAYYEPEYLLHLPVPHRPNLNSKEHLDMIKTRILENLSRLQHAPGVQFSYVPPDFFQSAVDDPDYVAQLNVGDEGGGLAREASNDSLSVDSAPNESSTDASLRRKRRMLTKLQYSRRHNVEDRHTHVISKAENPLEFYEDRPRIPMLELAEGIADRDHQTNHETDQE